MMKKQKPTIKIAAPQVTRLFVEKSSASGATISTMVPSTCAVRLAAFEGRMSFGNPRYIERFNHSGAQNGVLLIIGGRMLWKP